LLINAWRYDTASSTLGKGPLYGLPKDFTTAIFYVNVDLFNAAGVPVPYKGWTWDEFETAMQKITALNDKPEFAGKKIYGGFFQLWPDTLRNMMWTFGGDFFGTNPDGSPNFRDVTLDEPRAQETMQLIARTRLKDGTVYNPTGIAKDGGQEFFNGNIGCTGPVGQWLVPRYTTINNFKWDCVPTPHSARAGPASGPTWVNCFSNAALCELASSRARQSACAFAPASPSARQSARMSAGTTNGSAVQPRYSRAAAISSAPSGLPWTAEVPCLLGAPLPMTVLQATSDGRGSAAASA
jgi:ABC-type glycerol-3-phosphate transport system substrate-binding protein